MAWRPPLTPSRAAGTVRIHGADPGSTGPPAKPSDSGFSWRYTVVCFLVIPARVPCGHGAGAKAQEVLAGSLSDAAQLLPGQVEVAAVGGT